MIQNFCCIKVFQVLNVQKKIRIGAEESVQSKAGLSRNVEAGQLKLKHDFYLKLIIFHSLTYRLRTWSPGPGLDNNISWLHTFCVTATHVIRGFLESLTF